MGELEILAPEVRSWEQAIAMDLAAWGGRSKIYTTWEILRRLGGDKVPYTGKGVRIAVLDSGVYDAHPMLRGRVVERFMVVPGTLHKYGHGCISPDTYICTSYCGITTIEQFWNELAKIFPIQSLPNGDDVITIDTRKLYGHPIYTFGLDPETFGVERARIGAVVRIPIDQEIVVVRTATGTILKLTPWHTIFVLRNGKITQVPAEELMVGDAVAVPALVNRWLGHDHYLLTNRQIKSGFRLSQLLAWALGYMLGDGSFACGRRPKCGNQNKSVGVYHIRVYDTDIEPHQKLKLALSKFATSTKTEWDNRNHTYCTTVHGKDCCLLVKHMLGFGGETYPSKQREIPKSIARIQNLGITGAFIAGYLDADGNVCDDDATIRFSTTSYRLAQQLCFLLKQLGILYTTITTVYSEKGHSIGYNVNVCGREELWRLWKICGEHLASTQKRERWVRVMTNPKLGKRTHKGVHFPIYGDLIFDPIAQISKEHYRGYFFDLSVEKYENYLAGVNGCCFVHNTAVSSIAVGNPIRHPIYGFMRGVAPGAELIDIKVMRDDGRAMVSDCLRGLEKAEELDADIVVLSLGVYKDLGGKDVLSTYIAKMKQPVFCAAGNRPEMVCFPANGPESIAVGSVNWYLERSAFSGRGPAKVGIKPDLTSLGGDMSVKARPPEFILVAWPPNKYEPKRGTSYSNPIPAGVAALMMERGFERGYRLDRRRITEILYRTAKDLAAPGKDNDTGWGINFIPEAIKAV